MTRYVIIGAGAVGVTLAAELHRAGREAVLVGRGRQLKLLPASEVRYLKPEGGWAIQVPAIGGAEEILLNSNDVLVLATKTQDADQVLAQWAREPVDGGRWRAGEVLPVLTLQNGLDVERSALRRFATVIGSVLAVPATYVTDGEILSPGAPAVGVFWLGNYPDGAPSAAASAIAADLQLAGFEAQVVDDLSRWKAGKLLASVTFALDALYAPGPERDQAARLVQAEAREILIAAGLDVADLQAERTIALERFAVAPIEGHPRPGSSTFQSLARGRKEHQKSRKNPRKAEERKTDMAVEFISAVNVNPSNELNGLGRADIDLPFFKRYVTALEGAELDYTLCAYASAFQDQFTIANQIVAYREPLVGQEFAHRQATGQRGSLQAGNLANYGSSYAEYATAGAVA